MDVFNFKGNDVRVVEIDSDAKSKRVLQNGGNYQNQAVRKHYRGGVETTTPTAGGSQKIKVIPERDGSFISSGGVDMGDEMS